MKIEGKFLRLSEEENALDYLRKAHDYISQTGKNVIAWKWVILALHDALYGFAICALKGTNSARVTYQTKRGEVRLISFDEALKRCQDSGWMHLTAESKHLQLSDQQKQSIRQLQKTFRNSFVHFIPKGWSIEIHGFPQIAMDILDVIRFLGLDTGNYVNFNKAQMKKVKSSVFQSKRILKKSKLYEEAELVIEDDQTI